MFEHKANWLKKIAQKNTVSGGYIFTGPSGVGKKTLAYNFSCLLTGESKKVNTFIVRPEVVIKKKKKYEADIHVKDIRGANHFMSLKAGNADHKVCIIERAEKMTEEAQNALLKNLEEPKHKSVYIMLAESEQKLLPTIRSRSVLVKLGLVHPESVYSLIRQKNISPEIASLSAYYGWGTPEQSLSLAENGQELKKAQRSGEKLLRFLASPLYERLDLIGKEGEDRAEIQTSVNQWITMLTAALEMSLGAAFPTLEKESKISYNPVRIGQILSELILLKRKLNSPGISARLALEAAFLNF